MIKELFLKGDLVAEIVLYGHLKSECNLVGKFAQGKGVVVQGATKPDILNLFNMEVES